MGKNLTHFEAHQRVITAVNVSKLTENGYVSLRRLCFAEEVFYAFARY